MVPTFISSHFMPSVGSVVFWSLLKYTIPFWKIDGYLGLCTFMWKCLRPANTDPVPLNDQIRVAGTEPLSE